MATELKAIADWLLKAKAGVIRNIQEDAECKEYSGCNFQVESTKIRYRKAKITPKKVGQFVTLWRRNSHNQTEPFDVNDTVDYYMIATLDKDRMGFSLFSKNVLSEKHILTHNNNAGKRGFRVYTDWDIPTSNQAESTKKWQKDYFIDMTTDVNKNIKKFKALFNEGTNNE